MPLLHLKIFDECAAASTTTSAFATGLEHPRSLVVLPNADVLVAKTSAQVSPDHNPGIKRWFFRRFQKKGHSGVPSANRIKLLRDAVGSTVWRVRASRQ